MRCNRADILLSAYLDKELNTKESSKLEKHLAKCEKCREKLELLKSYSALSEFLDKKEAPVDLADNVWSSIESQHISSATGSKQQISKTKFRIAAAIAAILIAATLIPFNIFRDTGLSGQFYIEIQKGGKGPAKNKERPDEKLTYMKQLAEKCDAEILDQKFIPGTQKLRQIILKLPNSTYTKFREEYNSLQTKNPLPESAGQRKKKNIRIIISFPINKYVLGDFTGDGYADMLVHTMGGEQNNSWRISETDSLMHFDLPKQFNTSIDPTDYQMVSGDINGDSYDDLILFDKSVPVLAQIYLNRKGKRFKKPYTAQFDIPAFMPGEIFYLSGDINGDSRDDLILHFKNLDKPGPWFFIESMPGEVFSSPQIINPDNKGWTGTSKYLPFVADLNGDGLDDTGIYGQSGERNAWWYVNLNLGNGIFEEEKNLKFGKSALAFQGEYLPFWGDLNADGLDDFIIKYGKESYYSKWVKELNTPGLQFVGMSLKFSGREDFSFK